VKGVAGSQGEFMSFSKARGIAEMLTVDRDNLNALAKYAVE